MAPCTLLPDNRQNKTERFFGRASSLSNNLNVTEKSSFNIIRRKPRKISSSGSNVGEFSVVVVAVSDDDEGEVVALNQCSSKCSLVSDESLLINNANSRKCLASVLSGNLDNSGSEGKLVKNNQNQNTSESDQSQSKSEDQSKYLTDSFFRSCSSKSLEDSASLLSFVDDLHDSPIMTDTDTRSSSTNNHVSVSVQRRQLADKKSGVMEERSASCRSIEQYHQLSSNSMALLKRMCIKTAILLINSHSLKKAIYILSYGLQFKIRHFVLSNLISKNKHQGILSQFYQMCLEEISDSLRSTKGGDGDGDECGIGKVVHGDWDLGLVLRVKEILKIQGKCKKGQQNVISNGIGGNSNRIREDQGCDPGSLIKKRVWRRESWGLYSKKGFYNSIRIKYKLRESNKNLEYHDLISKAKIPLYPLSTEPSGSQGLKQHRNCASDVDVLPITLQCKQPTKSLELPGIEEWSVIDILLKGWKDGNFDNPPVYLTHSQIKRMSGFWRMDKISSDKFDLLFKIMELSWIQRQLLNHLNKLQVVVTDESFRFSTKALGRCEIGSEIPLSGKRVRQPRADGRKGYLDAWLEYRPNSVSVISCWDEPLAAHSEDSFELSGDGSTLIRTISMTRETGEFCSIRLIFNRICQ